MRKTREGYVQLVNGFYMNWKVRKLRLENPTALGVFAMILSYCGFNLSDGWITGNDLKYVIGASDDEILALCDVEMLIMDEKNDKYMVHDYLRHNRSNEQVTKKRVQNTTIKSANTTETVSKTANNDETGTLFDAKTNVIVPKSAKTSAEPPKTVHVLGQTSEHQNIRTSEHQTITPPTPSQETITTTINKPDFDSMLTEIEKFYPAQRWDGRASRTRLAFEVEWPKIVTAAGSVPNVPAWFVNRTRAYVNANPDSQYVKNFSRYLGAEAYATPWENSKPATPPPSQQMLNRKHNFDLSVSLMTDEEKRRYGVPVEGA